MGSFNGDIKTIRNSRRGEDVRDAIIDALTIINNGSTATSLEGIKADQFVKRSEWNDVFPLDTTLTKGGSKGVTSAAIYNSLVDIKDALDRYILRSRTINPSPDELTKIRDAGKIIDKMCEKIRKRNPGSLTFSSPLSDYPNAILNIEDKSNVKVGSITITENGLYPKEDANEVYNQVTVDVKENLIDNKQVNKLEAGGTLVLTPETEANEEDKKKDGYKNVSIDVKNQFKTLNLDETSLKKEDGTVVNLAKETLKVNASSVDGALAFKDVKVDFKSKIADLEVAVDPDIDNGKTFYAETHDGIDSGVSLFGYRKIHLTISEGKATFVVTFLSEDRKQVLDRVEVPKHGDAKFTKSKPKKSGYTFVGWDPDPVDVVSDMSVCAQFEKSKDKTEPGKEVPDSWDEIARTGGENVSIGSWKYLHVGECTYQFFDNASRTTIVTNVPEKYYKMVKVGEGEEGSTSTWISQNGIPGTFCMYNEIPWVVVETDSFDSQHGWYQCPFRQWLNTMFYRAIVTDKDDVYGSLGKKIRMVKKYTHSFDTYTGGELVYHTLDYIWLPTPTECGISGYNEPGSINYAGEFGAIVNACPIYRSATGGNVGRIYTSLDNNGNERVSLVSSPNLIPLGGGFVQPNDINLFKSEGHLENGEAYAATIYDTASNKYHYIGLNSKLNSSSMDASSAFNLNLCTFSGPRFGFCT